MQNELSLKTYKTRDFAIATFLAANGFELLEIDRSNPPRATFILKDRPDRQSLIQKFWADEPVVGCKKLLQCQRELKQRLYGDET